MTNWDKCRQTKIRAGCSEKAWLAPLAAGRSCLSSWHCVLEVIRDNIMILKKAK